MRFSAVSALCFAVISQAAIAAPLPLFTTLSYSGADNSPPPPDAVAVYDSALDVDGLAAMPAQIAVDIPRDDGPVVATIQLEHMDRREGFAPLDPAACASGTPGACQLVPIVNFPENQFSYTWVGQGNGYDLRLTVHHGHAVGVLVGPGLRYSIGWAKVKELRMEYFKSDEGTDDAAVNPPLLQTTPTMSTAEAQAATVARILPKTAASPDTTELDMLFLFTEEARIEAGGDPSNCGDTDGLMAHIEQRVSDMNTAFSRSLIPAQIGVATISKLYGYGLIPFNGDPTTSTNKNRLNISKSGNIKAFRNAVGADVVSAIFDRQANLGPCGVANVQRHGCTYPIATADCDVGAQFSEWTYYLDTVECTITDAPPHELGHVLGAEHNASNTNVPPAVASFPYSYGYNKSSTTAGFETLMSQRFDPTHYAVRLLQFSNPSVLYNGMPTGNAATADDGHTLRNLLPGTAAFRNRPDVVFSSGFEISGACPGVTY